MNWKIIINLFLLFAIKVQIFAQDHTDAERTYYWFYIKIDKILDRETKTNRILIKNIENEEESGSFIEFTKSHLNGLKSGKIYIGPFSEEIHCKNSQSYYRNWGKYSSSSENASGFGEDDTYSFFYMKPIGDNLSQAISFERIPSRVTSGNIEDFKDMLNEGLTFEQLAIGPFLKYELAEKSKFIYRKNGEAGQVSESDSINSQNLRTMAKKWKTLGLEIIKQADNKDINNSTYRFSTKFPRKYFAPDAFQVITIKAFYNEPVDNSTNSFTLQGDQVVDNNPIISNDQSTVYINVLNFDKYKDNKIKSFSFEGFVYNNNEIIELEPVYVNLK